MSQAAVQLSFLQQLLSAIERTSNKVPHPAIIFLSISATVIVLSHLLHLLDVRHLPGDRPGGAPSA